LVAWASTKLATESPIEEQTLPRYSPQRYYPVRLGESFKDKYLVIAKLGYGGSSTVWLARDTQAYVTTWHRAHYAMLTPNQAGGGEQIRLLL
jgi:hypothetical protein